jgi:hypothetical protein
MADARSACQSTVLSSGRSGHCNKRGPQARQWRYS